MWVQFCCLCCLLKLTWLCFLLNRELKKGISFFSGTIWYWPLLEGVLPRIFMRMLEISSLLCNSWGEMHYYLGHIHLSRLFIVLHLKFTQVYICYRVVVLSIHIKRRRLFPHLPHFHTTFCGNNNRSETIPSMHWSRLRKEVPWISWASWPATWGLCRRRRKVYRRRCSVCRSDWRGVVGEGEGSILLSALSWWGYKLFCAACLPLERH